VSGFEKSRTPTIQQTYDKQAGGADTTLDIALDTIFDIKGNDSSTLYNAIRIDPDDAFSQRSVLFDGNDSVRMPDRVRMNQGAQLLADEVSVGALNYDANGTSFGLHIFRSNTLGNVAVGATTTATSVFGSEDFEIYAATGTVRMFSFDADVSVYSQDGELNLQDYAYSKSADFTAVNISPSITATGALQTAIGVDLAAGITYTQTQGSVFDAHTGLSVGFVNTAPNGAATDVHQTRAFLGSAIWFGSNAARVKSVVSGAFYQCSVNTTGTITLGSGVGAQAGCVLGGTLTSGNGLTANGCFEFLGGTVVDNLALLVNPTTVGTTNWGMGIEGATANNYILGRLSLGSQTAPGSQTGATFVGEISGNIRLEGTDAVYFGGVTGDTDGGAFALQAGVTGQPQFTGRNSANNELISFDLQTVANEVGISTTGGTDTLSVKTQFSTFKVENTTALGSSTAPGSQGGTTFDLEVSGEARLVGNSAVNFGGSAGGTDDAEVAVRSPTGTSGIIRLLGRNNTNNQSLDVDLETTAGGVGLTASSGATYIDSISVFKTSKGVVRAINTYTTTQTLAAVNHVVLGNHATTAFTITLPSVSSAQTGREIVIKNINTATVTVDGDGSETIDGSLTVALNQYDSITIISDGSNWHII
jgi:hypothetical protein